MIQYIHLQIIITAILVSVACALPGTFLVLRGVALMSDAISHAILLGIILMFFVVQRLDSPLLMVGAALAGLVTVICTQGLIRTRRVKEDAAIGLVFPLFFSIGVILISVYARNVHLDTDMVLLGEIAFAPFNRLVIGDCDLGPISFWVMGVITALNILFIRLWYTELMFAIFDEDAARVLGIWPTALYYGLMSMTSITAVGAFDIVGSIVVVALMVTPAASAYLYASRVPNMIGLSLIFGAIAALIGCISAFWFDVSIAGSIAVATGAIFCVSFLCAPAKGVVARWWCAKRHQFYLSERVVAAILQGSKQGYAGPDLALLTGWKPSLIAKTVDRMALQGQVEQVGMRLFLTQEGQKLLLGEPFLGNQF